MTTALSIAVFIGLLADPCYRVRDHATRCLINFNRFQDLSPWLDAAKLDPDPEVAARAWMIEQSLPPLKSLMHDNGDDDYTPAWKRGDAGRDGTRAYCRRLRNKGWKNKAIAARVKKLNDEWNKWVWDVNDRWNIK